MKSSVKKEGGQQDSKKKSKQERKEDKAPRASVCSVDAALLGGRPRLQHLGGRECAATSLEDGTLVVINVSSGEQRVTGAAALEEAKRTADGLMGRHASSPGKANPSAAALVGYSPDWDSLFVCSTSRQTSRHIIINPSSSPIVNMRKPHTTP